MRMNNSISSENYRNTCTTPLSSGPKRLRTWHYQVIWKKKDNSVWDYGSWYNNQIVPSVRMEIYCLEIKYGSRNPKVVTQTTTTWHTWSPRKLRTPRERAMRNYTPDISTKGDKTVFYILWEVSALEKRSQDLDPHLCQPRTHRRLCTRGRERRSSHLLWRKLDEARKISRWRHIELEYGRCKWQGSYRWRHFWERSPVCRFCKRACTLEWAAEYSGETHGVRHSVQLRHLETWKRIEESWEVSLSISPLSLIRLIHSHLSRVFEIVSFCKGGPGPDHCCLERRDRLALDSCFH